jgi:phosphoenolpyruvate synthase/pyruvate phosphate dikinase
MMYKNKFELHLAEKYKMDFVIDRISYDIFHGGTYHAYAYNNNDPNEIFYVGQNPGTKEIEDSYQEQVWKKLASEDMGPIIEEMYPDSINYSIQTIPDDVPSNQSFTKEYKIHTTIEVGISLNVEITDENRAKEMEKAFMLLNAIKGKDVQLAHFGIGYKNKTLQIHSHELSAVDSMEQLDRMLVDYR